MTPNEWKAQNRNKKVADIIEQAVKEALPAEREAIEALAKRRKETNEKLLKVREERALLADPNGEEAQRLKEAEEELEEYLAATEKIRAIDFNSAAKWILNQCACAATWEKIEDHYHQERIADTEALQAVEPIQRTIKKLRNQLMAHKKLAQHGIAEAILDLKAKGIKLGGQDGKTRPVDGLFDTVLTSLHDGLAKPAAGIRRGPFMHRSSHGCLLYTRPVENLPKLPGADTMLLFAIVLFFRCHSLGIMVIQQGQTMPEEGTPHFALAAKIVSNVFADTGIAMENDAQMRLHHLIGHNKKVKNSIGWIKWHHDK